ncbi:Ribosomal RNA adenine dimethylase [Maioricimonas rarisocia]|uniref:Ribosomal RNA small subunit methyltransferase A n=1 Tax=Maioricimonas rarisocia TaxID=2528026 RepID=A0A517Z707_9PLAN|nr:16S rRNA (adenine(1518)-N(6)/adenine(1519)-N(6))-dimethyltransferase RsmA [Maioricimonas rarisocia]QDU38276.1 Ribosomal RNA adenine dimethylase [Maioricimonas rarisocia]
MKNSDRQTRSYLMELFDQHGFHPRTDLGQNFLIDLNIVEFVVERAELTPQDVVLEVGAGTGGMTTFMAQQAGHVVSVELDRNMHKLASVATSPYDNVTLLNCDALKNKNSFNPDVIAEVTSALEAEPGRRLKLVANLPYSIATPVVSNLVATEIPWARMVVTIQFELGLRMRAKPRSSHYGSLSVWLQSQCDVAMIKKLGPTVFWPRPKVNSAIMQIMPSAEKRAQIVDRAFFQDYVRRLFHHRRKFLRSVLVGMYRKQLPKAEIDALLEQQAFEATARAEELDVATHVQLANALCEAVGQAA